MGNTASNSWSMNYRLLKESHDAAYRSIDVAISLEEQERPNEAIEKYKEGIQTIDKALDVVIACPDNPDETWKKACDMVQKMKKSRAEVMQRINSITSAPGFIQTDPPPAYQDVVENSDEVECGNNTARLRTYSELAQALDNIKISTPKGDADVLICCDNVVQYFITPDGEVSELEPQKLTIAILENTEDLDFTYFLNIGNWIYPLIPGVSPCYRTEYRAFIFPDVYSSVKGASVGIVIPADADDLVLEILEDILLGVYTDGKKVSRQRREIDTPGSSVANGIVTGAGYLSRGLVFTASKVGDLLNYGTPKLISSIRPAPATTEVPTKVSKSLKIAETTTGKAAEVTGVIADKIGIATSKLGQFLAPHIERQGTKLLTTTFNYSEEEASSKMTGVFNVAAGAVEGFGTVYQGLHTSATILGQNLKDNSVKIVQHKYGESAGALANDTLGTVGNVISIRGNARIFTPKGLAKNTVKQTGKALIRSAAATTVMANAHAHSAASTSQNDNLLSGDGHEESSFKQPGLELVKEKE